MDKINRLMSEIDNLGRQGRDVEMIPIFHQLIKEVRLIDDEGLLARVQNDFGGVLRNTGYYNESISVLEEAKNIVERISGKNSVAYVTTLLNLGTAYLDAKLYSRAGENLECAKKIANFLNMDNLVYAAVCNNLGMLYIKKNMYREAYELQKVALDILRLKENSRVKLAIACSNFAETCKLMGNIDQYFSLLDEASKLLVDAVGERHPLYATVTNNLATTYYREGQVDRARELLVQALDILEETYGKSSKGYLAVKQNLDIANSTDIHIKKCDYRIKRKLFESEGLNSSYTFFKNDVEPMFKKSFGELWPRVAFGLVGKGSECMGFDDELSKDHDYECKLHLLLTKEDYLVYAKRLDSCFRENPNGKLYVVPIDDFFIKYTGLAGGPNSLDDWKRIPEHFLATAVSGQVFIDNLGEFTKRRDNIAKYYPPDYRLKKLAFHCLKLGQSGQYNYPRSLRRNDSVAAMLALSMAIQHAMAIVYILNKVYRPFYKWQYKKLQQLDVLGKDIGDILDQITRESVCDLKNIDRIEHICSLIISYLKSNSMSSSSDTFILSHGYEIHRRIIDESLKNETPWTERGLYEGS